VDAVFKFLRNLRKGTIENKSVRKYLFYAVGEILLVMIGILLALQVNNWNEARKARKEEQVILAQLQSEFRENQAKLERVYQIHGEVNRCLRALLEAMGPEPGPLPPDSLNLYMGELSHIPFYKPLTGSVTSLLSTGKLSLISNDSLRLSVSNWPRLLEDYRYTSGILYDMYNQEILPYLIRKYHYRNVRIDTGLGNSGRSAFEADPRELLSDPELENIAEIKRVDSEVLQKRAFELLTVQESILQLIRNELKSGGPD
jgi:hypothetical protein